MEWLPASASGASKRVTAAWGMVPPVERLRQAERHQRGGNYGKGEWRRQAASSAEGERYRQEGSCAKEEVALVEGAFRREGRLR